MNNRSPPQLSESVAKAAPDRQKPCPRRLGTSLTKPAPIGPDAAPVPPTQVMRGAGVPRGAPTASSSGDPLSPSRSKPLPFVATDGGRGGGGRDGTSPVASIGGYDFMVWSQTRRQGYPLHMKLRNRWFFLNSVRTPDKIAGGRIREDWMRWVFTLNTLTPCVSMTATETRHRMAQKYFPEFIFHLRHYFTRPHL